MPHSNVPLLSKAIRYMAICASIILKVGHANDISIFKTVINPARKNVLLFLSRYFQDRLW